MPAEPVCNPRMPPPFSLSERHDVLELRIAPERPKRWVRRRKLEIRTSLVTSLAEPPEGDVAVIQERVEHGDAHGAVRCRDGTLERARPPLQRSPPPVTRVHASQQGDVTAVPTPLPDHTLERGYRVISTAHGRVEAPQLRARTGGRGVQHECIADLHDRLAISPRPKEHHGEVRGDRR